jgi:hypothetical protein
MKVSKGCKKHRIIFAGANFSSSLANSSRDGPDAAAAWDGRLAYTVNEAIRLLSISRGTFYKLKKLKLIDTGKICGRRLITRASILELLKVKGE